jgi:hypothetical protein
VTHWYVVVDTFMAAGGMFNLQACDSDLHLYRAYGIHSNLNAHVEPLLGGGIGLALWLMAWQTLLEASIAMPAVTIVQGQTCCWGIAAAG